MIRPCNIASRAAPFDRLQVAEIGDVPIVTFDLKTSVDIITTTTAASSARRRSR